MFTKILRSRNGILIRGAEIYIRQFVTGAVSTLHKKAAELLADGFAPEKIRPSLAPRKHVIGQAAPLIIAA